jgi:RNA polymerase primary sigma factor
MASHLRVALLGSRCHHTGIEPSVSITIKKEYDSMSTPEDQDVSLMALDQYIREVRWLEPLTQEEEAQLIARVERGKQERRQSQPDAWRLSLAQAARTRLIEGYQPWVIHLAKGFVSRARSMYLLDLIQEGNLGVMEAIEHNDVSKGYPLRALVTAYVRGAILDALRERDRMVRVPDRSIRQVRCLRKAQRELLHTLSREATYAELAAHMQLSVEKVCELVCYQQRQEVSSLEAMVQERAAEEEAAWVSAFAVAEPRCPQPWDELIAQAMQTLLTERQRTVMQLRCGFGEGSGPMRTQKEVAELAGVAWITVLRDERRGKAMLREALAVVGTSMGEEVAS